MITNRSVASKEEKIIRLIKSLHEKGIRDLMVLACKGIGPLMNLPKNNWTVHCNDQQLGP